MRTIRTRKRPLAGDHTPVASLVILLTLILSSFSVAQEAADYFRQNCVSCHTIGGGRLTGPDLKNVEQRRDRSALSRFMVDPKALIDAGDPYVLQLQKDARGVVMPTIIGMTKARAEALLDLITAESKLPKSQFVGMQLNDRPFTQADIDNGKAIFLGQASLANGGPACISCHSVNGVGGLGGGQLAPDLTTVFERYQGRKTLAIWLSAPATPTMGSVFKKQTLGPDEILSLTAFFQSTLQRSPEDASTSRLNFVLIGLAGALLMLALFDVLWHNRFRAVRKPMVEAKRAEMTHEQQ